MAVSPPPRVLLDVDGRAVCARLRRPEKAGFSTPIVLAAGGAGQGTDGAWGPTLEDGLAEIGPVVTYDRAGSGRSDGPQHGTAAGMAEELHRVLEALGLQRPAVIVGWSLGAFVAEGYVLRYPDMVAGLVFVDPTPTEPPPQSLAVQVQLALAKPQMTLFGLASRVGLFSGRLGERLATAIAGQDATPETTALARRLMRDPLALGALSTVMGRVPRYSSELAAALESTPLPDVPVGVISAGKRGGVPEEYVTSIRTSHERLAGRFERGRLVNADRASHQVPYDDPGIVVDTVRSVLAAS